MRTHYSYQKSFISFDTNRLLGTQEIISFTMTRYFTDLRSVWIAIAFLQPLRTKGKVLSYQDVRAGIISGVFLVTH